MIQPFTEVSILQLDRRVATLDTSGPLLALVDTNALPLMSHQVGLSPARSELCARPKCRLTEGVQCCSVSPELQYSVVEKSR